jgi:hypothetical protein
MADASREVYIEVIVVLGRGSFGKVEDFASSDRGEGARLLGSRVVADRRRDWCELPESIEERLGDFL